MDRRATDPNYQAQRSTSPSNIALMNGTAPPPGFTAVNARSSESNTDSSRLGASEATKAELLKQFAAVKQLKKASIESANGARASATPSHPDTFNGNTPFKPSTTAAPPTPTQKDDGGPYKAEILARVEAVKRGDRIIPPCDRCRRLRMDCLKNLTACHGCTKKHAKCSWKDVKPYELATPLPLSGPDVEASDPGLEQLRRAVRDGMEDTSHTNSGANDADVNAALSMHAAAGLAEVAKASTAALESTEVDLQQPHIGQSPNLAHTSSTHQSPNISNYGAFSPPQHPPSHGTSINMPYANAGRRISIEQDDAKYHMDSGHEGTNGVEHRETEYAA
jgi:hypothetical protein